MNLLIIIKLAHTSINRNVSSEAKQFARQAWLGLKKMAGESLFKLFFGYVTRALIAEVLHYLITHFTK
ncbi:hypothetical protein [Collimonas fungivorans]|uniref:hypothetical protein n=1 Tax=Collimonas fungivorans TaxID=158899 RepID=UPI00059FF02F|nr:hypothetical protein [Collimonas fungivorans]